VCAPCPHPVSVVYQPRLVALVSIDGAEAGTRSVSAYCADCRCVLEPRLDDVYVSEGVLADDKRYGRSIDHASRSIGQPGPWKRLGLPSWSDVAERRGIERISRSALFEDYTAHDRARVGELIQHHLGLSRGRSTRSMAAPAPIANIHVSLETVKHFLDDFSSCIGRGLATYATCRLCRAQLKTRLRYGRAPRLSIIVALRYYFLRPYLVASSVINHMVVVAENTGWVVTAFSIDDDTCEGHRDGSFRFASYCKK
jgi:hypothetical protein